jgi:uncharacterized protein with HEPN domain
MNDQDKEHMRIMFAGFIVCGMIMKYEDVDPKTIWNMADAMIDAKDKQEPEVGIVAAKTRRRK